MIYLPGYGLYPASWLRRASRVRFQGQASRELLEAENMGDAPSPKVEAAREELRRRIGVDWSRGLVPVWFFGDGISTVGIQHWSLAKASGRDAKFDEFKDNRDAIEVLVSDDPKFDETARAIPRLVGDVPVFVQRSGRIVALADVEGRSDDDSTAMAHNWTGTRGGWYDYAGPEPTPGGRDDMNEVPLHMLVTGPTLKELLLDSLNAAGGVYRPVNGEWRFFLDPVLRVKLALAGLPAPCSVRAEPLVCLRTPPPLPTLGGFIHPGVGVYCRPAGIPAGLEQRYRVVLSNASTFGMADAPGALKKAEQAGVALNRSLGIAGKNKPRWWLYTLPRVAADGRPEVAVGIAGDVAMDRELPASFAGVPLVQEIAYPKQGMGSAPIDTVWPTDSPDYHEPTGDATGDDDPALADDAAYNGEWCPKCGLPAVVATRCIPMSYECASGHRWTPAKENSMSGNGAFVTLADLVSSGLNPKDTSWGDDGVVKSMPKGAGTVLIGQTREHWTPVLDVIREIDGETVRSMPAGSATMDAGPYEDNDMGSLAGQSWDGNSLQTMPPETFSGQGAPIEVMPSGGLNRGVPTGYEGQAWVNKDWNMGDLSSAARETRKLVSAPRMLGAGFGAAAGFFAVRMFSGDKTPGTLATTVAAAVGAVSGLLAANAAVTALEN